MNTMLSKFVSLAFLTLVATFGHTAEPAKKTTRPQWTPPAYTKAVGYRFKLPGEDSNGHIEETFSLIRKGVVDTARLEQLKVKETELSPEQIKRLTTTLNAKKEVRPSACYSPHHIFIFYSAEGKSVAAVEVCFLCSQVSTLPFKTEQMGYYHDFIGLARLTDQLGLWLEKQPVKQWVERQARWEKLKAEAGK